MYNRYPSGSVETHDTHASTDKAKAEVEHAKAIPAFVGRHAAAEVDAK